jgi:hypothetical protein
VVDNTQSNPAATQQELAALAQLAQQQNAAQNIKNAPYSQEAAINLTRTDQAILAQTVAQMNAQDDANEKAKYAYFSSQPRNDLAAARTPAVIAGEAAYAQQKANVVGSGVVTPYQPAATNPYDPNTAAGISWEVNRGGGNVGKSVEAKSIAEGYNPQTFQLLGTSRQVTDPLYMQSMSERSVTPIRDLSSNMQQVFYGEGSTEGRTFYTGYGDRAQTKVDDSKIIYDNVGGSFNLYQRPASIYENSGFVRKFGIAGSGGGVGALQSGMFSVDKPLTDVVYKRESGGTQYAEGVNEARANEIVNNPSAFSRLGAEAYGGIVSLLDGRTLTPETKMGRYEPSTGNLANLVDPYGVNKEKSAFSTTPWKITDFASAPAFSTVNTKGELFATSGSELAKVGIYNPNPTGIKSTELTVSKDYVPFSFGKIAVTTVAPSTRISSDGEVLGSTVRITPTPSPSIQSNILSTLGGLLNYGVSQPSGVKSDGFAVGNPMGSGTNLPQGLGVLKGGMVNPPKPTSDADVPNIKPIDFVGAGASVVGAGLTLGGMASGFFANVVNDTKNGATPSRIQGVSVGGVPKPTDALSLSSGMVNKPTYYQTGADNSSVDIDLIGAGKTAIGAGILFGKTAVDTSIGTMRSAGDYLRPSQGFGGDVSGKFKTFSTVQSQPTDRNAAELAFGGLVVAADASKDAAFNFVSTNTRFDTALKSQPQTPSQPGVELGMPFGFAPKESTPLPKGYYANAGTPQADVDVGQMGRSAFGVASGVFNALITSPPTTQPAPKSTGAGLSLPPNFQDGFADGFTAKANEVRSSIPAWTYPVTDTLAEGSNYLSALSPLVTNPLNPIGTMQAAKNVNQIWQEDANRYSSLSGAATHAQNQETGFFNREKYIIGDAKTNAYYGENYGGHGFVQPVMPQNIPAGATIADIHTHNDPFPLASWLFGYQAVASKADLENPVTGVKQSSVIAANSVFTYNPTGAPTSGYKGSNPNGIWGAAAQTKEFGADSLTPSFGGVGGEKILPASENTYTKAPVSSISPNFLESSFPKPFASAGSNFDIQSKETPAEGIFGFFQPGTKVTTKNTYADVTPVTTLTGTTLITTPLTKRLVGTDVSYDKDGTKITTENFETTGGVETTKTYTTTGGVVTTTSTLAESTPSGPDTIFGKLNDYAKGVTQKVIPAYTDVFDAPVKAGFNVRNAPVETALNFSTGVVSVTSGGFVNLPKAEIKQTPSWLPSDTMKTYFAEPGTAYTNPKTGQSYTYQGSRPYLDVTAPLDQVQNLGAGRSVDVGKLNPLYLQNDKDMLAEQKSKAENPNMMVSDYIPLKADLSSAVQGLWDMPRERPLDAAIYYAMPIGFGEVENAAAYLTVKALSSKSPTIVKAATFAAESPMVGNVAKVVQYTMMGDMVASETARVPGYSASILNPVFGKPLISRTVVGQDAAGNDIYASQSPQAVGKRSGEAGGILGLGYVGGLQANELKIQSVYEMPVRTPGIVTKAEGHVIDALDIWTNPSSWANWKGIVRQNVKPQEIASSKLDTAGELTPKTLEPTLVVKAQSSQDTMDGIVAAKGEGQVLGRGSAFQSTTNQPEKILFDHGGKEVTKDIDGFLSTSKRGMERQNAVVAETLGKKYETQLVEQKGFQGTVETKPEYTDDWVQSLTGYKGKNVVTENVNSLLRTTLGEANPESFNFVTTVRGVTNTGNKLNFVARQSQKDVGIDTKLATAMSPREPGASRVQWWGTVREPKSVADVPNQGLGTMLFGDSMLARESRRQYMEVPIAGGGSITAQKLSLHVADTKSAISMGRKIGTRSGEDWDKSGSDIGKRIYALKGSVAEQEGDIYHRIFIDKSVKAEDVKPELKTIRKYKAEVESLMGETFSIRKTPEGKIEKVTGKAEYDAFKTKYDAAVAAGKQPSLATPVRKSQMGLLQQPFAGSSLFVTPTGVGGVAVSQGKQSKGGNILSVSGTSQGMFASITPPSSRSGSSSSSSQSSSPSSSSSKSSSSSSKSSSSSGSSSKSSSSKSSSSSSKSSSSSSKSSVGSGYSSILSPSSSSSRKSSSSVTSSPSSSSSSQSSSSSTSSPSSSSSRSSVTTRLPPGGMPWSGGSSSGDGGKQRGRGARRETIGIRSSLLEFFGETPSALTRRRGRNF